MPRKKSASPILRKKRPRKAGAKDLLDRFGRYLNRRRLSHKLSIRQFAKSAGIPHTNIFQFECLRKNPRLTEVELLAKAFGQTMAQFLEPLQRDSSAASVVDDIDGQSATSASIAGQNSQII